MLEEADILRERADAYGETHRLSAQQHRVVDALLNCRTAALGELMVQCDRCENGHNRSHAPHEASTAAEKCGKKCCTSETLVLKVLL